MSDLITLPDELLLSLLQNLPGKDLLSLCLSNQQLSNLCNEASLWQTKLQDDYPWVVPQGDPRLQYAHLYNNVAAALDSLISKVSVDPTWNPVARRPIRLDPLIPPIDVIEITVRGRAGGYYVEPQITLYPGFNIVDTPFKHKTEWTLVERGHNDPPANALRNKRGRNKVLTYAEAKQLYDDLMGRGYHSIATVHLTPKEYGELNSLGLVHVSYQESQF